MYRSLDAEKITETARVLGSRIVERFPGSSLGKVPEELHAEARQAAAPTRASRPPRPATS